MQGSITGVSSPTSDTLQRRFAIANLIAQLGIIGTGGAVRVTGSGLGCSTWPLCEPGAFTPIFHDESTWHSYIEYGNRTLTGVLVLIAGLLGYSLYRKCSPQQPEVRPYVWGVLTLIGVQAVVGGMSVWAKLHPAVVGLHMAISLGLVSLSTMIVYRIYRPMSGSASTDGTNRISYPGLSLEQRILFPTIALLTVAVALLGVVVTGTGPHSGDAEKPYRFALDPIVVTRIHSLVAWLLLLSVIAICYLSYRRSSSATVPWLIVLGMLLAQGVLGYIQYFSGLHPALVVAHMLGSGLTVVSVTWAISSAFLPRSPTHVE